MVAPMPVGDFAAFFRVVMDVLDVKAREKGYIGPTQLHGFVAPAYKNEVLEFTERMFGGHALGEIVYKALRYKAKGDPEDLKKIAAWAALIWRQNHGDMAQADTGILRDAGGDSPSSAREFVPGTDRIVYAHRQISCPECSAPAWAPHEGSCPLRRDSSRGGR